MSKDRYKVYKEGYDVFMSVFVDTQTTERLTNLEVKKRLNKFQEMCMELKLWKLYASFCRCCANSGEAIADDFDFDAFKKKQAALSPPAEEAT